MSGQTLPSDAAANRVAPCRSPPKPVTRLGDETDRPGDVRGGNKFNNKITLLFIDKLSLVILSLLQVHNT